MYECYVCGSNKVIWDNDFMFEDYGYEGDGIVHEFHCMNCGADITVCESFDNYGEDAECAGEENG